MTGEIREVLQEEKVRCGSGVPGGIMAGRSGRAWGDEGTPSLLSLGARDNEQGSLWQTGQWPLWGAPAQDFSVAELRMTP